MTAGREVAWRHAGSLAVIESDDRVAVLDLDHLADPPRILDGSAAAIWRAVDGVRSTPAVVAWVAESFGVQPAEVEADVVAFLDALASAGLLEAT